MNCWEYHRCGREPDGAQSAAGVCPASTCRPANGIHYGTNGGRVCWAVRGTQCQCHARSPGEGLMGRCLRCGFYDLVHRAEVGVLLNEGDIRCLLGSDSA